jgi:hypothetical protein
MKKSFVVMAILWGFVCALPAAQAQTQFKEEWKGHTVVSPLELGILGGAAPFGTDVHWSVLMTGAVLLEETGWADDLDDRIWIELQAGPAFFDLPGGSQSGFQYSAHLRWDFTYNEFWNFYGLGGLAGFKLPSGLGNSLTVRPRFGVGVQYQTKAALMFRAELSAEFIGAGIGFNF